MIKKHKKKIILAIIVVAISLGLFFLTRSSAKRSQDFQNNLIVEKGSISTSVEETGQVASRNIVELGFGPSGVVADVFVEEGSFISRGDVIARLDTRELEAYIKQTQGQIAQASSGLSRVSDIYNIDVQQKMLENTELDLELAKAKYDKYLDINDYNLEKSFLALEIRELMYDLSNETEYYLSKERREAVDFHEDMATGQEDIVNAQYKRNLYSQETQTELEDINKDIAKLDHNIAVLELQNFEDDMGSQLEKLEKGFEISKIQLEQTQKNRSYDIRLYNGQIMQAQGAYEIAKYNLEKASIVAPFDGVVTRLPFKSGQMALPQGGDTVEIVDMKDLKINVGINEVDIVDIKVGQKSFVDFDGIPDEKFDGEVAKIYPGPKVIDGVVVYSVDVRFAANEKVFLGMTANVEIITEEKDDALSIPIIAVVYKDNKRYVRIKSGDDKIEMREITIGIQSDTDVEIVSGLTEGETIVY
jgi:HlyD family secretion protein